MKTLAVFGATSAISQAFINRVADRYERVVLVARNPVTLDQVAAHVGAISGAQVATIQNDLADIDGHPALLEQVFTTEVSTVLVSYGELPDQVRCIEEHDYGMQQFVVNGSSAISLSAGIASRLRQNSTLAVVSSVAGDRGRRSNYYYGAAKGALSDFLSGLRSRLQPADINVLTIKPGFVDTPMTASFKKGALWASADKVAADIDRAIEKRRSVLYTPWFWGIIMLIIRCIPEPVFKRLPL